MSACSTATSTTTPISRAANGLRIAGPITTDAKVIPSLVARNSVATGADQDGVVEAFRRAVAGFDGSVAIGAVSAARPDVVMLALRGGGQGIYVGIAEDRFVAARASRGIVEETDRYLRLDGEHGGQFVALDAALAGTLAGVARFDYDGAPAPVVDRPRDRRGDDPRHRPRRRGLPAQGDLRVTRQPRQGQRGKIADDGGQLSAVVGSRALPLRSPGVSPPGRSSGSRSSVKAPPLSPAVPSR